MLTVMEEFVRNIVTFSVLAAFCIHLLPVQRYQKCARFVIGLVYICMLLDAAGALLGKTIPEAAF